MLGTYIFYQWRFFYVPHLLRQRTSDFKVIFGRPVILTSECRALGEGPITSYFIRLRFDVSAREEVELTTSWMLSESTTSRLLHTCSRSYPFSRF
jgi:hypothetical protein